jgi:hypothetical protein
MSCEPAYSIITRLGGPSVVAEALGLSRQGVWRWTRPKSLGGTDGLIPVRYQSALVDLAKRHNEALDAALVDLRRQKRIHLDALDFVPLELRRMSA